MWLNRPGVKNELGRKEKWLPPAQPPQMHNGVCLSCLDI